MKFCTLAITFRKKERKLRVEDDVFKNKIQKFNSETMPFSIGNQNFLLDFKIL